MPVRFIPTGQLDITTDPTLLPEQTAEKLTVSDALTRCTNLRLGHKGMAVNRWGSSKVNPTAIDTDINLIVEHSGARYTFAGDKIYKNEVSIASSLTEDQWSAIIYNQYNSDTQNIYALNGTDRKRITGTSVDEWGADRPIPGPFPNPPIVCTHDWELHYYDGCAQWGMIAGNYQVSQLWEAAYLDESDITKPTAPTLELIDTEDGLCTLGKHKVAVAYVTDNGETDLGTPSIEIQVTADYSQIKVKSIAVGGSDVVARRIYMTKAYDKVIPQDAEYFHVHTYYDNTSSGPLTIDIADDDMTISSRVSQYQCFNEATETSSYVSTDVYGVKYTYVIKEGDSVVYESNPSDAKSYTIVATSAGKPMIVFYEKPSDTRITHARFYRTLDAAGAYYYDSEIDIKRGQAVLTKTDAQLGSEAETGHDRPPTGTFIIGPNYGGISFILKDNLVYYSMTGRPEYWPADYYLEVSTKDYPLLSGTFLDTQFYVASKRDIFLVTVGTTMSSKSMNAITGTQSRQVFTGVKGHGLFHLGIDGLYQLTGSQYQPLYQGEGADNNITNLNLRQIWEGETVGSITGMNLDYIANCFLVVHKSKVFFAYPGTGSLSGYCDNMLVFGLIHKKVVHYQYPVAFRTATVDFLNNRLLAADESGYIWHIEDQDKTDDEGTVIDWELQSKDFTLFHKMFPRTARYDVEVGTSATGYIQLNGVSKQTHTLNGQRNNKRRLITSCTGDRLSIRLAGTGTVKIHKVEIE